MSLPKQIEIACPKCGGEITVKVGRNDATVQSCPKCSALLDTKELIAGFQQANKELAALERKVAQVGFKRVQ